MKRQSHPLAESALIATIVFAVGATRAAAQTSSWGTYVGYDESDNGYVFCTPDKIISADLSIDGKAYVFTYFRRVRSDGSASYDVTSSVAANRTRLQCYSNRSFTGTPTVVVSSASGDPQDSSWSHCPADKPYGANAECRIELTGAVPQTAGYDAPFVYFGTACGDGITGASAALFGQETGNVSIGGRVSGGMAMTPPFLQVNDTLAQAGIIGADLGNPFFSNFHMYYAFGDTNGMLGQFAHSTLAASSYTGGFGTVPFTSWLGASSDHIADQVIPPGPNESYGAIPSGGFSITEDGHNYKYLWLMSVLGWQPVLHVSRGSIAYSVDDGPWQRLDASYPSGKYWAQSSNFTNVGVYHQIVGPGAGYVYIYGIQADGNMGNSNSGVKLMRVKATHASITDPTKYEYWTGTQFLANAESSAAYVVDPSHHVRELSIAYDSYANRYIMMFMHANGYDSYIELLQSPSLTGPWTLVTNQLPFRLGNYAPMVHDRMLGAQGATLTYLMSEMSMATYNVGQYLGSISRSTKPYCY